MAITFSQAKKGAKLQHTNDSTIYHSFVATLTENTQ